MHDGGSGVFRNLETLRPVYVLEENPWFDDPLKLMVLRKGRTCGYS